MDTLLQFHVSSLRVRIQVLLKESDSIHNGLRLHYTIHTKKFSTRRSNGPTRYQTSFRLSIYSVRACSRSTTHEGYTAHDREGIAKRRQRALTNRPIAGRLRAAAIYARLPPAPRSAAQSFLCATQQQNTFFFKIAFIQSLSLN